MSRAVPTKLYCRNSGAGTVFVTGKLEGSFVVGRSALPDVFEFGLLGYAISLDGTNDYINVPDSASLSPTARFSLDLWVYQDAASGSRVIAAKGPDPAVSWLVRIDTSTLRVFIGNTADYGECAAPSTGAWHHLVVVFDGSLTGNSNRLKVWIDGVQQSLGFTGTIPSSIPNTSEALQLGAWNGGTNFNGDLDEVAFYNTALTASEIGQNRQRRRCLRGLVSWWRFNEGTGVDVADSALEYSVGGYNNPATLQGGATWVAHT